MEYLYGLMAGNMMESGSKVNRMVLVTIPILKESSKRLNGKKAKRLHGLKMNDYYYIILFHSLLNIII